MRPDPYSRSYWRFPDEYPDIYSDDAAYALWCRLRDLADMAWPAAGTLPYGVKKSALAKLCEARQRDVDGEMVSAPLVFLEPGGRYRIRGMDKQRSARQESARAGADARWSRANASAPAMRSHSERSANAMHIPSRAEQREESHATDAIASDPVETYHLLTARVPKPAAMQWLERMAAEHGSELVSQTMGHVWMQKADPSTFLSDVEAELVLSARRSARQADDARQKAEDDYERQERERIEAMSPEERAAVRSRFREQVAPLFGGLMKDMP